MIFSKEQVAEIRSGKITATLVLPSRKVRADTVRPLRRRYVQHNEDGEPARTVVETVTDAGKPIRLTIVSVALADVYGAPPSSSPWLTPTAAQACGYRTVRALQEAWFAAHPRTPIAQYVRFTLGDLRDRDRYLAWTGRAGGDYTSNPARAIDRDAPVPLDVQQRLTRAAHLKDVERLAHTTEIQHARSLTIRLKEALRRGDADELRRVRHEIEFIEQRMKQDRAA